MIGSMLDKVDEMIIGGGMAFTFRKVLIGQIMFLNYMDIFEEAKKQISYRFVIFQGT